MMMTIPQEILQEYMEPCFPSSFLLEYMTQWKDSVELIPVVRFFLQTNLFSRRHVNYTDHSLSPLIWAVSQDMKELVVLLLEYHANVNEMNGKPLQTACLSDNLDMVQILLSHGADMNQPSYDNKMPLFWACRARSLRTIQFLLEQDNIEWECGNSKKTNPLYYVCGKNDVEIADILLRNAPQLCVDDEYGKTLLMTIPHVSILRLLLHYHVVDVNQQDVCGRTALMLACQNGNVEMVRFLAPITNLDLEDHAGMTALGLAICHYQNRIIPILLQLGMILDHQRQKLNNKHKGTTYLMLAVMKDNFKAVEMLVERGVDWNVKNQQGETALHLACKYNRQQIIIFLLSLPSIEIDVEDRNGHTALTRAIQQQNIDIVLQLAKRSSCETKQKTLKMVSEQLNYRDYYDCEKTRQIMDILEYYFL